MSSDDRGRHTVIHHIGPAMPGEGRPAGAYGLRPDARADEALAPWASSGDQDTDGD